MRYAPFVGQLAMDSQEYDRRARAIVAGDGSGSAPFFQAPLYPYLVALVYRIFGPHPDAVYLAQIAVAGAATVAIGLAARRMLGNFEGAIAAFLFALYPPFWFFDVQLEKESFAVAAVAALLAALAGARETGLRRWFGAGLLLGVLALLRENALLVVPLLLPLAFLRPPASDGAAGPGARPARRVAVLRAAVLAAGTALALAPAALHNALAGGGFLPTTSQGGINFWIGNNAAADGTYRPLSPGKQIPALEREEPRRIAEARLGRRLSAAEVSRYWLGEALAWARRNPGRFLALQFRKLRLYWSFYEWPDAVDYYWMKTISRPLALPLLEFGGAAMLAAAGLLLSRRSWNALAPVLLFELGWMLSTVAFFLFSRYRLPAVPGLLVLAAIPIARAAEAIRAREGGRAITLAAFVAGAWIAPHLARFAPKTDLVEYNLGRLAEERHDLAAARGHYARALAAAPDDFLAAMNLGRIAARAGDLAAARELFARAVAAAPDCEPARTNLGAALLAQGDLAGAARELDAALALDSESREALHDRALVALASGEAALARNLLERLRTLAPDDPATRALAARVAAAESKAP